VTTVAYVCGVSTNEVKLRDVFVTAPTIDSFEIKLPDTFVAVNVFVVFDQLTTTAVAVAVFSEYP
jgi:hypothetical protein